MNYELAKELKDAGFSTEYTWGIYRNQEYLPRPTLEELIEACGGITLQGEGVAVEWRVRKITADFPTGIYAEASTPTEAVARLWLALKQK